MSATDDLRDPRFVRWPDTPLCHHTTLADFTSQPPVPVAPELVPLPRWIPPGAVELPLLEGYALHVGPQWEILTVAGERTPIGIYRESYQLRVDHRRRGLGVAMFVWRCELRGQPPADYEVPRSPASWALRAKGHEILVRRALERGCLVPERVLVDYPDLAGGMGA